MGFFNLTWKTQINRIMPPVMRGVNTIDFVGALVEGLQFNSIEYSDFEDELRTRARYNGKKLVLQAALNEIFGIIAAPFIIIAWRRGIASPTYFHPIVNDNTAYFFPLSDLTTAFFHAESDAGTGKDFTVEIPSGIHTTELEQKVNAEVIAYKIAGVSFDIIIV